MEDRDLDTCGHCGAPIDKCEHSRQDVTLEMSSIDEEHDILDRASGKRVSKLDEASEAFHNHPSNPSSCEQYEAF